MKPFALETVLKYRSRLKDMARNRFHKAQAEQNKVRAALEQRQAERNTIIELLSIKENRGIDVEEHIRFQNHIDYLAQDIERLQELLRKKQEIVTRERTVLMEKAKEEKALENLKERQNLQWRQYLDKKEALQLDEIAVIYKNR